LPQWTLVSVIYRIKDSALNFCREVLTIILCNKVQLQLFLKKKKFSKFITFSKLTLYFDHSQVVNTIYILKLFHHNMQNDTMFTTLGHRFVSP